MSNADKINNIYFLPFFTANRMKAIAKPVMHAPPEMAATGVSHPAIGCTEALCHSMTAKLPQHHQLYAGQPGAGRPGRFPLPAKFPEYGAGKGNDSV